MRIMRLFLWMAYEDRIEYGEGEVAASASRTMEGQEGKARPVREK